MQSIISGHSATIFQALFTIYIHSEKRRQKLNLNNGECARSIFECCTCLYVTDFRSSCLCRSTNTLSIFPQIPLEKISFAQNPLSAWKPLQAACSVQECEQEGIQPENPQWLEVWQEINETTWTFSSKAVHLALIWIHNRLSLWDNEQKNQSDSKES